MGGISASTPVSKGIGMFENQIKAKEFDQQLDSERSSVQIKGNDNHESDRSS